MELTKTEMYEVSGGGLTSSMLNAISKAANTVYSFGKSFGSSIRRIFSGSYCPVR